METLPVEVPTLTASEIREELGWLFQRSHRSHLVALWGHGSEGTVEVPNAGRFYVVPARSELELRDRLPPLEARDERQVFLVPWAQELPLDIAGRFALGGRVLRVGRNRRLPALLGVSEADPEAVESRIAEYILRCDKENLAGFTGGKLTLDGLWSHWLRRRWHVPAEAPLTMAALMGWAATNRQGPSFVAAVRDNEGEAMRAALLGWLGDKVGPAAGVVWRAWEHDLGRLLLEHAIVFEGVGNAADAAVTTWLEVGFGQALAPALEGLTAVDAATKLAPHVEFALAFIRKTSPETVSSIIAVADALVKGPDLKTAVSRSRRLPCAWNTTCDSLAALLRQAAIAPSAALARQARELHQRLENHELFKGDHPKHRAEFARAEMAVRLAAWLAGPHANPEPISSAPYAAAEALGRWYCEHGGYVDWARRACRATDSTPLGKAIDGVLAAADERRVALDRRFAHALAVWLEAGRPGASLAPIYRAFEAVGAAYLDGHPSRRLLVLLMDGMGWAQASEILLALGEENNPWQPLAWHELPQNRKGGAHYPPVVADLPSDTPFSRAAFFAGKPMPAGPLPKPGDDASRWAANKAAQRFCAGNDVPVLLLRDEVATAGGALSEKAQQLIEDTQKRVVAVVLNVIDSSLHDDPQQAHEWNASTILPLHGLLDAAKESGRAVLLVSDHGHVPAALLANAGSKGEGSPRWHGVKSLAEASAAKEEYEIVVDAKHAWAAKGNEGVVLVCDDQHRYGGNIGSGTHGGASLAEVMIPTVLLGWAGMEAVARSAGDDETVCRTQGLFIPRWWAFEAEEDLPPIEEVLQAAPAPKPSKKSAAAAAAAAAALAQPPLPGILPSEPAAAKSPSVLKALADSQLFEARVPAVERPSVLKALHFLMQRDNAAPAEAFAATMGLPMYRVPGWVSTKLGERLNLDGYLVVTFNAATNQVLLHRSMLEQLFEVKL